MKAIPRYKNASGSIRRTLAPDNRDITAKDDYEDHTILVDYNEAIHVCGSNSRGQCSPRIAETATIPMITLSKYEEGFIARAFCGYRRSVILTVDHRLIGFGDFEFQSRNSFLALKETHKYGMAKPICSAENIHMVGMTRTESFAVSRDGKIFNIRSEHGGNLFMSPIVPQPLLIRTPASISCGDDHVLIIDASDNQVWGMGSNTLGQLGLDEIGGYSRTPVKIKFRPEIQARGIAAGATSSLVLGDLGEIYSFGYGAFGQLGHGLEVVQLNTPSIVPLDLIRIRGSKFVEIHSQARTSIATDRMGRIWVFGDMEFGTTDVVDKLSKYGKPYRLPTIKNHKVVFCGHTHTLFRGPHPRDDKKNALYAMGSNSYGQSGNKDIVGHTGETLIMISDEFPFGDYPYVLSNRVDPRHPLPTKPHQTCLPPQYPRWKASLREDENEEKTLSPDFGHLAEEWERRKDGNRSEESQEDKKEEEPVKEPTPPQFEKIYAKLYKLGITNGPRPGSSVRPPTGPRQKSHLGGDTGNPVLGRKKQRETFDTEWMTRIPDAKKRKLILSMMPLKCSICAKPAEIGCALCMSSFYCNQACLSKDWNLSHRSECPKDMEI